jgi:hypothetical protein
MLINGLRVPIVRQLGRFSGRLATRDTAASLRMCCGGNWRSLLHRRKLR